MADTPKKAIKPSFFPVGGANGAGKITFIAGNFPPDRYEINQADKIWKEFNTPRQLAAKPGRTLQKNDSIKINR